MNCIYMGYFCTFDRMGVRNLHQPYEIVRVEENKCECEMKTFRNTFFEMVFVLEGKGIQMTNDLYLPYSANKLFLIFPQDTYGFTVEETTIFFVLRFNLSFLKTQSSEWRQRLEYIFDNYNHLPGCILKNITDKPLVRSIAEALLREQDGDAPQKQEVIKQLINSIITIAARNIALIDEPSAKSINTDTTRILDYIHLNIFQPEKLKISGIASHFNISKSYFSEYFKRKIGQSFQAYITSYKIKQIEERLQYSDKRLAEIAYEFGFNDVSHLNHFFKRQKDISPTEYRKKV